nr:class I SAM-dependent methyltransferase [Ornithinimicrobium sediminis]
MLDRQGDVLDLGCGTGRVAWRLAELGHRVVGVDLDPRMLGSARARDAEVAPPTWVTDDLTAYRGEPVDVVLLAGNVVPLVGSDHLQVLTRAVVHHLRPGALLVSGFGLDEEHLPDGCPVMPLTDLDRACDASGLQLLARWGTWHGEPLTGDYAVSVHTLSR